MSLFNLKEDNLPLLLALMLAFITWGLEHIVEESLKTPIIEYSVSKKNISKSNSVRLTYNFSNLSREKRYDNLELLYLFSDSVKTCNAQYIPDVLAISDDGMLPFEIDTAKHAGSFHIATLQPLASFKIIMDLDRDELPALRYKITNETVILKEYSFEVFLVKNEFTIILILIGIFILILTVYAIKFKPRKKA